MSTFGPRDGLDGIHGFATTTQRTVLGCSYGSKEKSLRFVLPPPWVLAQRGPHPVFSTLELLAAETDFKSPKADDSVKS